MSHNSRRIWKKEMIVIDKKEYWRPAQDDHCLRGSLQVGVWDETAKAEQCWG